MFKAFEDPISKLKSVNARRNRQYERWKGTESVQVQSSIAHHHSRNGLKYCESNPFFKESQKSDDFKITSFFGGAEYPDYPTMMKPLAEQKSTDYPSTCASNMGKLDRSLQPIAYSPFKKPL